MTRVGRFTSSQLVRNGFRLYEAKAPRSNILSRLSALPLLWLLGMLSLLPGKAVAGPVDLFFTTPTNKTNATVSVTIGSTFIGGITIPAGTDANGKRDIIKKAITDNAVPKFTVDDKANKVGDPGITIQALTKGTKVSFNGFNTGEKSDSVVAQLTTHGSIGFQNTAFASVDANGLSSTFTAGILTDLTAGMPDGTLSFTFNASDFADLSGTTIATKFFDSLMPLAAGFGFGITRMNDVLDISFDLARTSTQGGVVFGTTALTPGVFGEVDAGDVPEPSTLSLLALGITAAIGFRASRTRRSRA